METTRGTCALAGRTGGRHFGSIGQQHEAAVPCHRLGCRASRRQGIGLAVHVRGKRRPGCTAACQDRLVVGSHGHGGRARTGIGRRSIVGGRRVGARLLSLRRRVPGRAKLRPVRLADAALRRAAHRPQRGAPPRRAARAAAAISALVTSQLGSENLALTPGRTLQKARNSETSSL